MVEPALGKLALGKLAPGNLANLPKWRVWLLATRPATLTAVAAPLAVAAVVAWRAQAFHFWAFAAALAGAFFIQIGTNFANDVFDFEKGADTAARKGPLRVTQAGLVTPLQVKRAMWLAFALAVACGVYLVQLRGWPLVALGLASIASGILYTGGPAPLGYLGLGDVFVFGFFGVAAVVGAVFVQVGVIVPESWLWSVPVGASCTAILVVNNLRDADTDRVAGKRTLAVRIGKRFARGEYVTLMAFALLMAPIVAIAQQRIALLLPLVAAPAVFRTALVILKSQDADELNQALATTAKLHLALAALLAVGLALDR